MDNRFVQCRWTVILNYNSHLLFPRGWNFLSVEPHKPLKLYRAFQLASSLCSACILSLQWKDLCCTECLANKWKLLQSEHFTRYSSIVSHNFQRVFKELRDKRRWRSEVSLELGKIIRFIYACDWIVGNWNSLMWLASQSFCWARQLSYRIHSNSEPNSMRVSSPINVSAINQLFALSFCEKNKINFLLFSSSSSRFSRWNPVGKMFFSGRMPQ